MKPITYFKQIFNYPWVIKGTASPDEIHEITDKTVTIKEQNDGFSGHERYDYYTYFLSREDAIKDLIRDKDVDIKILTEERKELESLL